MGGFLGALVGLVVWPLLVLGRVAWSLLRLIVIAAVLVGATKAVLVHTPVSWPDFELSAAGLTEYLRLAFATVASGWLPIGIAMIFLWTLRTRSSVDCIKSDTLQTKIAIVALMNYLDLGVETEGTKAVRQKGFKSIMQAWKTDFWLWLLLGKREDDALTARPVRLNSGASVTFGSDIDARITRAHRG